MASNNALGVLASVDVQVAQPRLIGMSLGTSIFRHGLSGKLNGLGEGLSALLVATVDSQADEEQGRNDGEHYEA